MEGMNCDIQTETTMTMIGIHGEQARVLVQDLLNDYFGNNDESASIKKVGFEFHRVATFVEIVECLLSQIIDECNTWNDRFEKERERARKNH